MLPYVLYKSSYTLCLIHYVLYIMSYTSCLIHYVLYIMSYTITLIHEYFIPIMNNPQYLFRLYQGIFYNYLKVFYFNLHLRITPTSFPL